MENRTRSHLAGGLVSREPANEYADKLMLYGQFVGDWVADAIEYADDGSAKHSKWDIRFDWILEGRAIQDIWISPVRQNNTMGWHQPGNRYSTTIRMYDPKIDAWHILWINPPNGHIIRQLGREIGNEIMQIGEMDDTGQQSRWVYRDIQLDSFRWCNEKTIDNGNTWKLMQEMQVKRVYP